MNTCWLLEIILYLGIIVYSVVSVLQAIAYNGDCWWTADAEAAAADDDDDDDDDDDCVIT